VIRDHLRAEIPTPEGVRKVELNDIAILVKSNADGDLIARVLRDAQIPAVRAGIGAVDDTSAARQLRALLHAIARPSDARRARMIASGWFFGLDSRSVMSGPVLVQVQARIAVFAQTLAKYGIYALWSEIQHDPECLAAIARLGDGDRGRTDLDHLVEIIHRHLEGRTASAERCLSVLDALTSSAGDSEERRRRIESDARAVQITTMHASKGLEYPIVLIPFGTKQPNLTNIQPYVFGHDNARWVDAGPNIAWNDSERLGAIGDPAIRKAASTDETIDEDARLAYVALTRAKHRLVIWVRHGRGAERGGLGRILWGERDAVGVLRPGGPTPKPEDDDDAAIRYEALAALAPGCIAAFAIEPGASAGPFDPNDESAPAPSETKYVDRPLVRPNWRAWSYSTLTAEGTGLSNYGPEALRDDEIEQVAPLVREPNAWDDLSAGTGFGDAVHRILEEADFSSLTGDARPAEARAALLRIVRSHAFRLAPTDDPALLTERLIDVATTKLGPAFSDASVAEVLANGSLRELGFSLELGDGATAAAHVAAIADGAELLDGNDPFRDYFRRVGPGMLAADDIRGYLTGSIDLVARHRTGGHDRYVVVDYKTNRSPNGRYDRDAMIGMMEHGNYPLQAALYSVVVHRLLHQRLGSRYDPHRHLGGASYWFVRGMTGAADRGTASDPSGVMSWRPSVRFIEALDGLMSGRMR
jgi:exodeoxyribonuclease V beta subunit